jgi:hypothetical protein
MIQVLAHSNFHLPELGADAAIDRLLAEFAQVRVLRQPAKIAIAEIDGLLQGIDGFLETLGEAEAAGKVIKDQGIPRAKARELLVNA